MATQVRDVHYHDDTACARKSNVTKAQKNGGRIDGRKPLGEISNSAKQYNLKQGGGKNSFSKHQPLLVKPKTGGERKPLGDISNSRMHQPPTKKKLKKSKNLDVLVEEDAIMDEHFLHNHDECIKEQKNYVDLNYFLETVGLHKDSSMKSSSKTTSLANSIPTKIKCDQSTVMYMDMQEMDDLLLDCQSPSRGSKMEDERWDLKSPLMSPTFKSIYHSDEKFVSFTLKDSP